MSKYASLLFAPDTYHVIGPFRFPVYHDLVPGEARGIEQLSKKQSRTTFESIKLAQRIAKDKGITTKAAVELLSNSATDEDELLYDYAQELESLQDSTIGAVEQQIAFVTLFMQHRAEAILPETEDWKPLTDWTEDDTASMPSKFLEQVFRLILWERDGWPAPEGKPSESEPENPPQTKP